MKEVFTQLRGMSNIAANNILTHCVNMLLCAIITDTGMIINLKNKEYEKYET